MTVIGLYAISGAGKSHLLSQLSASNSPLLPHTQSFIFKDGSTTLAEIVPGGIKAFAALSASEQAAHRAVAIQKISTECSEKGKHGVVAGHYMFWDDDTQSQGVKVGVDEDWKVYTHIVYLRVDADIVARRRREDGKRQRSNVSVAHLAKWQREKIAGLREVCLAKGILFTVVEERGEEETLTQKIGRILLDFRRHDEYANLVDAEKVLDNIVVGGKGFTKGYVDTFILLDADRTLAPQDTGALFYQTVSSQMNKNQSTITGNPLKAIFSLHGYTYFSFRQATLLYEEYAADFETICSTIASMVTIYPQILTLL
jgi:adenylate kinase